MEHRKFKKLLDDLVDGLSAAQVEKLKNALDGRGDHDEVCRLMDEHFEKDKKCPHCGEKHIHGWGDESGLRRWKCMDCNRTFNALTGTPLAGLRQKEKWLGYMRSLIEGVSVRKAADKADISINTSFRWRHRMLEGHKNVKGQDLNGVGEVDETFFRESFKGSRNMPRLPKKRGEKAKKRGLSKEQIPVLIARDRSGSHIDAVLPDRSKKSVKNVLAGKFAKDILLCTESDPAIIAFAKDEGIKCETIVARKGQHARGHIHVQNVNGYISRLKKWMKRFNGVATRYLPSYIGWRRMVDMRGDTMTPERYLISAAC